MNQLVMTESILRTKKEKENIHNVFTKNYLKAMYFSMCYKSYSANIIRSRSFFQTSRVKFCD